MEYLCGKGRTVFWILLLSFALQLWQGAQRSRAAQTCPCSTPVPSQNNLKLCQGTAKSLRELKAFASVWCVQVVQSIGRADPSLPAEG